MHTDDGWRRSRLHAVHVRHAFDHLPVIILAGFETGTPRGRRVPHEAQTSLARQGHRLIEPGVLVQVLAGQVDVDRRAGESPECRALEHAGLIFD